MKICVYAVALNESLHVKRFCDAAADADLIFVADTGSTDGTQELLRESGAQVANIRISPWRFDDARNAALSMLPGDIDVCVSLDLDEVLQPGWRAEIERVWTQGTTQLRYGFDWGAGIAFQYEKIHARHGIRWHHPCHEYPVADRINTVWAQTDMLMVVHKPDPTKSRGQYLDLLKISIEEDPHCPRNAFYYARELSFHRQWQEAIVQAERCLSLPRATCPNERCYAMRVIGRCYQELGDYASAITWHRRATSEAPGTREPWAELAMVCYRLARWPEALGAALCCLGITNREKVYTADPIVWGSQPHDIASIAAYNMGLYELAIEHARKAIALDPDDLRLRQNLSFCQEKAA
jgi:glycosyltransferase involved in cell wall biosynthesis